MRSCVLCASAATCCLLRYNATQSRFSLACETATCRSMQCAQLLRDNVPRQVLEVRAAHTVMAVLGWCAVVMPVGQWWFCLQEKAHPYCACKHWQLWLLLDLFASRSSQSCGVACSCTQCLELRLIAQPCFATHMFCGNRGAVCSICYCLWFWLHPRMRPSQESGAPRGASEAHVLCGSVARLNAPCCSC